MQKKGFFKFLKFYTRKENTVANLKTRVLTSPEYI